MSIQIVEVLSSRQQKEFINLPWDIYKNDPNWVPPLKLQVKGILNKRHPFYQNAHIKLWLAYDNNTVVGRIAAIVNQASMNFNQDRTGFFGFFESIDNQNVATLLFEAAEQYLKENKINKVLGPMNPSTNYECGLLIEGFDDPPQIMMSYNFPYYQKLIENCGYAKAKDLLAFDGHVNSPMPERIVKISKRLMDANNITLRHLDKSKWNEEVATMLEIYNDAWEKNWGFIPMDQDEFVHMANELKHVADERLILFAYVKNNPVGFVVSLPDYNQIFKTIKNGKLLPFGIFKLLFGVKKINRFRIITLGIKKDYQHMGLGSLFYTKIQDTILQLKQYQKAEQSWILEDNTSMIKPLLAIGLNLYKKYRIFEKVI